MDVNQAIEIQFHLTQPDNKSKTGLDGSPSGGKETLVGKMVWWQVDSTRTEQEAGRLNESGNVEVDNKMYVEQAHT